MHGEYKDAVFPNGEVNVIRPKINPHYMSFHEIKKLVNIGANSYIKKDTLEEHSMKLKNLLKMVLHKQTTFYK